MTPRRTSQILVLLAALFGVLAFVCACRSARPDNFPNGPSAELITYSAIPAFLADVEAVL